MNKQKSIGKALLTGVAIFALWTTLILGAIGFATYFNGVIGRYKVYLNDILSLTLTEIDANDMETCINTGKKSESFEKTQDFLNRVKENYDIEFIYIVKPLNTNEVDNMMDVMAGITREEAASDFDF